MQDVIAIGVTLVATAWLARSLWKRFFAPPCRPPHGGPAGSDGFVPLDQLKERRDA
jgi:hypothetical protein